MTMPPHLEQELQRLYKAMARPDGTLTNPDAEHWLRHWTLLTWPDGQDQWGTSNLTELLAEHDAYHAKRFPNQAIMNELGGAANS